MRRCNSFRTVRGGVGSVSGSVVGFPASPCPLAQEKQTILWENYTYELAEFILKGGLVKCDGTPVGQQTES